MASRIQVATMAAILAISFLPTPTVADNVGLSGTLAGQPSETIDTSGIAVVGPTAIQFKAETEDQAMAFDSALSLAFENRDHMGYPWIDLETATLLLSAVDDVGEKTAGLAIESLSQAGLTAKVSTAQASISTLDEIADEATRLVEAKIPHADLIWKTEPDQRDNVLVITVANADPDLMAALASRFGTKLIAVRVQERGLAASAGRDSDIPAFWGGAYISTSTGKGCTTGFSWTPATGLSGMLTAGHCISTGGTISYPSYANAGSVASGSEENWNDKWGTQYMTGQTVYRGDVALIRYSGYSSAPEIYSGAAHTSTHTGVWDMATRRSQFGDSACINGVTTGLWCGVVVATGENINYLGDGFDVWARNMVEDDAQGWTCPTHGDSGAPVYRIRDDGNVRAVGIFSGDLPIGIECSTFFTDIWDAYYAVPGVIKHL